MSKTELGVALVTGASSGIGRTTTQALKRAGHRVFATSRRGVPPNSDNITMLICDVTDDDSASPYVQSHQRRLNEKCASQ
jgi:NADP-dependent 3-hydroxy acid dehydrogenase YdfG